MPASSCHFRAQWAMISEATSESCEIQRDPKAPFLDAMVGRPSTTMNKTGNINHRKSDHDGGTGHCANSWRPTVGSRNATAALAHNVTRTVWRREQRKHQLRILKEREWRPLDVHLRKHWLMKGQADSEQKLSTTSCSIFAAFKYMAKYSKRECGQVYCCWAKWTWRSVDL